MPQSEYKHPWVIKEELKQAIYRELSNFSINKLRAILEFLQNINS